MKRTPGRFFDTNVLLYLTSQDRVKADVAEKLVDGGGAISVQVLNEIANVTRRKMGFSWAETHSFLSPLRQLLVIEALTVEIHGLALVLAERHNFSIYDAAIVASALQASCDILLSEDMQAGMVFERRLRVVNPFRSGTR